MYNLIILCTFVHVLMTGGNALRCYYCQSDSCNNPQEALIQLECEAPDTHDAVCGSITATINGTAQSFKSCATAEKGVSNECISAHLDSRYCNVCNSAFCRYSFMEPTLTLCVTGGDGHIDTCNFCTTDLCNGAFASKTKNERKEVKEYKKGNQTKKYDVKIYNINF